MMLGDQRPQSQEIKSMLSIGQKYAEKIEKLIKNNYFAEIIKSHHKSLNTYLEDVNKLNTVT